MIIWVLLRRAYEGAELLGSYRNRPEVFEEIALAHPSLGLDAWICVTPHEFRLVDASASYSLLRIETDGAKAILLRG